MLAKLSSNWRLADRLAKDGIHQTLFFNSLRDLAIELLRTSDPVEMAGKRPCALTASAVYTAEVVLSLSEARKRRLTQRDLAECGDTAEYTIREQSASKFMPSAGGLAARLKRTFPPPTVR
jgi:hypothetical protein